MSKLEIGTALEFYDGEMELEGVAAYSSDEGMWVAVVDWQKIHPASTT